MEGGQTGMEGGRTGGQGSRLAGGIGRGGQGHLSRRRSRVPWRSCERSRERRQSEAMRGGGSSEAVRGAERPNTQRCRAFALDIRLKFFCLSDLGLDIEPECLAPMS
jgi:hypothetical protein